MPGYEGAPGACGVSGVILGWEGFVLSRTPEARALGSRTFVVDWTWARPPEAFNPDHPTNPNQVRGPLHLGDTYVHRARIRSY